MEMASDIGACPFGPPPFRRWLPADSPRGFLRKHDSSVPLTWRRSMRLPFRRVAAMASFAATLMFASISQATVPMVLGPESWDGSSNRLQNIVNNLYGPGAINVETDYIGHDVGEIDP